MNADYASALASNAPQPIKKDTLSGNNGEKSISFFIPLPSLSSLDTIARGYDGVFILLSRNEAEKTSAMTKEINDAINAIGVQGVRMGAFQLAPATPDFKLLNAQLLSPGVVVIMKGKGMRGVSVPISALVFGFSLGQSAIRFQKAEKIIRITGGIVLVAVGINLFHSY